MAEYVVITTSVGGSGNNIYRSGETVTEASFIPGSVPQLVKDGFLRPKEDKPVAPVAPVKQVETPEPTPDPSPVNTIKEYGDISANEIKIELDNKGIFYKEKAQKKELYALYSVQE